MRADTLTTAAPVFSAKPRRRAREVRDPYDGLRPWSAITHGVGAVLSVVGTVLLLLRAARVGSWTLGVLFFI
mgnify:CR=1 FL=1